MHNSKYQCHMAPCSTYHRPTVFMRIEHRIQLNDKNSRKKKGACKSITFIIDNGTKDISYADRTCNEHSYTKGGGGGRKKNNGTLSACSKSLSDTK